MAIVKPVRAQLSESSAFMAKYPQTSLRWSFVRKSASPDSDTKKNYHARLARDRNHLLSQMESMSPVSWMSACFSVLISIGSLSFAHQTLCSIREQPTKFGHLFSSVSYQLLDISEPPKDIAWLPTLRIY